MRRLVNAMFGACFLMSAAGWAQADTIALQSFSGGTGVVFTGSEVVGWEFTVSSGVNVTALGAADFTGLGLLASHDVGIFTTGGTLLASATVPSGTAAALDGGFRYESLGTSVSLGPGEYVIAMTVPASSDSVSIFNSTATTASQIHYVTSEIASGTSLALPTNAGTADKGIFGPNFEFTPNAAVPEPSTFALLALGGIGLAVGVTRRRFVTV